jgi:protein phosphatase
VFGSFGKSSAPISGKLNKTSDPWMTPAAITDTGCERELNEDRYAVLQTPSGIAWFVCDGMGGQSGGELAAQIAIDAIRRDLELLPARPPELALRNAFQEANRTIVLRRQNQAFAQMGTTAVAALIQGAEVVLGNVGDSRVYHFQDGNLKQLTVDHTYVQRLVESGEITMEEALAHPDAHILTRCLGAEPRVDVDIRRLWLWKSKSPTSRQALVFCSDGLYTLLRDEEIAQLLATSVPRETCARAVELAKSRGGFDNITLAILPIDGELREEKPSNFVPRNYAADAQATAKNRGRVDSDEPGIARAFLTATLLSVLSSLLTALGFMVYLSRS